MELQQLLEKIKTDLTQENKIIQKRAFDLEYHKTIIVACAGDNYVYDETNITIISKLLDYFNGKESDLSLNKGIMLIGDLGSGKSTLFTIFKHYLNYTNSPNKFSIIESRDICKEFAKNGFNGIDNFTYNQTNNNSGILVPKPGHLCIDDFGIESEYSKYYGTETNPVAEVLLDRYKIFKEFHKATHIITNLGIDTISTRYSDRIIDRFKEMFNIITLTGKSKRK